MRTTACALAMLLVSTAVLGGQASHKFGAVSNGVAAATPGTSYVTLDEQAFNSLFGEPLGTNGLGGRYVSTGTTRILVAPLHLPDHATVTEISYNVVDNSATGDVSGLLEARDLTVNFSNVSILSNVSTSGTNSSVQTISDNGLSAQVDNTANSYFVAVSMSTTDGTQNLHAVRVGFTTPTGEGVHFLAVPDRYVDSRSTSNRGGFVGPFAPGQFVDFVVVNVAGRDGQVIPLGAKGVIGTVTAVSPTGPGLFKILPGGTSTTLGTSTLNFNAGFTTATSFQARLDSSGRIRAFFSGTGQVDLLVDIVGYYY